MNARYTINILNNSRHSQDFFLFQEPARYVGSDSRVYSNSLYHRALPPISETGAILILELLPSSFAAAQARADPAPRPGLPSGHAMSCQPVRTARPGHSAPNAVTMSLEPEPELSAARHHPGVRENAFRISIPDYDAGRRPCNVGQAVRTGDGRMVLSSFIDASPGRDIDCAPLPRFYAGVGRRHAGTVIDFASCREGAAVCDAGEGHTTFNLIYDRRGDWIVEVVEGRPAWQT
ncbi:hypothetical protein A203_04550 [Chromobacterium violaceum]|uniref:Uncharacterized protein n=1 Tax=Chromobacterium violaceum (strain ATCC 12472 / DSM 30191 / JCM 1249 / CCUG 213 / NBRC 12614 / NCIMB 9131 / NCTC 9757 / MK) TaxID=243365 RepID=Q7NTB0_CHRVO|nr:hypothetical protein [Chromobacterium violaceum]AAQ60816.1 hypothetical protein CV_3149 [Chromobacterium violaceum ATCC 12472]MBP4048037.1 hypothetical protein [Chromobacterium violaceum]OQS23114.1 hypothetical protein B0T41_18325 [Chromobacterium violaceum]QIY80728.1 hypothetical protein FOB43_16780 [Chromobacterium violaceum]SUX39283.1 Uncharacterised protein [Chromobacterium violaceum]